MKTSVTMVRKMGIYDIHQRTQDGYFDANYLLQQWNSDSKHSRRRIDVFLNSDSTKDFIKTISERENMQITDNQEWTKNATPDYQVVIKGRVKTLKDGSKVPASIWMHPLLFIDFSMWINPSFKYDVLKFVYDELIKFRHGAGDMYVGLSKAVSKFRDVDYQLVAKALNYIVFGRHEAGIRNMATPEQLSELEDLEKNLAFMLDMGVIGNFKVFVNQLRTLYNKKWNPIKAIA